MKALLLGTVFLIVSPNLTSGFCSRLIGISNNINPPYMSALCADVFACVKQL